MEVLVILWPLLAILVGAAASARGRSGIGWFVLAILISPLLALLFLIAFPAQSGTAAISLSQSLQEERLKKDLGQYVRKRKPAFSNSVVYDVDVNGSTRTFKRLSEALLYAADELNYPLDDRRSGWRPPQITSR